MSKIVRLAVTVALLASTIQASTAGPLGLTRYLGVQVAHLKPGSLTLGPMAYAQFCQRYQDQCRVRHPLFRGPPSIAANNRWDELVRINAEVNAAIEPSANLAGLTGERWEIDPSQGDCNDYAVTKRAHLLRKGWPARSLLLSEVITREGEHHLVLVVRTRQGDFVLDNLTREIRPWSRAPYEWVRIQVSRSPSLWAKLGSAGSRAS